MLPSHMGGQRLPATKSKARYSPTTWKTRKRMSVLLIEAFYGGSHKQLMDLLQEEIRNCILFTLPAKKWHWRARTAALYFMQNVPVSADYRILFASSVLNLTELVALRPDLGKLKKILYFHENQLTYPVQKCQERDFQYGYNQILSWFMLKDTPTHTKEGLDAKGIGGTSLLMEMPFQEQKCETANIININNLDRRPRQQKVESGYCCPWPERHRLCQGEESPCATPLGHNVGNLKCQQRPLHIVWPHRWEHDKDPESFFKVLMKLKKMELNFHVSVLGEAFTDVPDIFSEAKKTLESSVLHWGYLPSRDDYFQVLCMADVVISTAKHEFFGVAMIEAVHCGCYPLCPNALVYPEIFPAEYLYSTPEQLIKRLQNFCTRPEIVRKHLYKGETSQFSWAVLHGKFRSLLSTEPREDL
ncbi:glycosyltransferase-like domain-containing protein 1 isoform X6 [Ahaetulla prasina]|uniref:glycosyltransferase-like domain-containing protein 1 isoform X6 n=1 Tax=Ahaetulla prasina TaxID=499056 RepID=UPI002647617F|nr:glycosyltransferase-like domain-containing protein 1 isoform X6 [Ahaetulla prasina]